MAQGGKAKLLDFVNIPISIPLGVAVGAAVCLIGTPLNIKERLFCGSIVLSVAVPGILITAPLGALGIDLSYKRLLNVYE